LKRAAPALPYVRIYAPQEWAVHKKLIISSWLFAPLDIYSAPQHVVHRFGARRRLDATLAALSGGLCRILQATFGELTFHALR
jgi:hypothetical protein